MTSIQEPTLKSDSKIETLRYNPMNPIVYEKWSKALFAFTGKTYGLHATLFHTGNRYVPPAPQQPNGIELMPPHHPEAILFN
jgi:hypothetical protein